MSHLKTFLVEQLADKEIELNEIEEKLRVFQEKEKIFALDQNSSLLLNNLTDFETNYNNILAQIEITEEREKYINKQLTDEESFFVKQVSNSINDRLMALKNGLYELENELILTISQYGESHSAVQILENKISTLKRKLEEETKLLIENKRTSANPLLYRQSLIDSAIVIDGLRANLNSRAKSYKKLVDEYDDKLSSLPEKILEYTRLERVRSIYAETYSFMKHKLEEARIGEASKLGIIRIVDKAIPNYNPNSPKKIINLIFGSLFGLIVGLFLIGIIEFLDNTIKSIEQVERRGLSILAMIPSIHSANSNKKSKKRYLRENKGVDKLQRRLIIREDPKSPISEAYRSLRTSLMYTKSKKNSHIILVSSAGPGEGKTTTIANLAITYANLGKKTILIDSDLRKPVVHKVFSLDKSPGLTNYLSTEVSLDKIINQTEINNLNLITSGVVPPNPSELLESNKMNDLLNELSGEYDVILFDSPPLIAVTDAFVLLKHVDQFALVVRAGVTEKGALQRVLTSINQSNLSITGVVMNAMSEEHSYGAGYYYNYYQYYYGESDNK